MRPSTAIGDSILDFPCRIVIEDLDAAAFAPFGQVIPAGPVDEHMMDARILASIERRLNGSSPEPHLSLIQGSRWEGRGVVRSLSRNIATRVVLIPPQRDECAVVVARDRHDGGQDLRAFRLPPDRAVSLRALTWFAIFFLGAATQAYAINADPSDAAVEIRSLRVPIFAAQNRSVSA